MKNINNVERINSENMKNAHDFIAEKENSKGILFEKWSLDELANVMAEFQALKQSENVVLDGVSVSENTIETMLMGAVINAPIYKDGLGILQYDKFKPMVDKEWGLLKKKSSR